MPRPATDHFWVAPGAVWLSAEAVLRVAALPIKNEIVTLKAAGYFNSKRVFSIIF